MSTLKVNAIQDTSGANESTIAAIEQGRAKAFCYYDGSGTYSILNSFGVSSLGDLGQGTARVTWTTAFSDANYMTLLTGTREPYENGTHGVLYVDAQSTTAVDTRNCADTSSGTRCDVHQCSVVCFQ